MATSYKLILKNSKVLLKTIANYIINLSGIKDNNTGTGNVSNGVIDWTLQHFTDTAANFTSVNPVLLVGQLGIETDGLTTAPKFKIGNGVTAWNSLPYVGGSSLGYTPEDVANKSTNVNTDKASSTKYPSVKAVYDWATGLFVKKGTLTTNYIQKATASDTIGDSQITDDGTNVGIGTASPTAKFHVEGANGTISLFQSNASSITGHAGKFYANSVNTQSNVGIYVTALNGFQNYSIHADEGNSGFGGLDANSKIYVKGIDTTSSNYALKADNSTASPLFYVRNDGLINIGGLTPSQIVATDASKNLQSLDVATYPSLTELSYVKGVTSAIQTQLNSKASNLIAKQNTTITHTGTTAETKIYSALITAGSVQANDVLKLLMKAFGASGVASKSFRMYFNTSDAIGGVQVGINTIAATSSNVTTRNIFCKNSLSSQQVLAPTNSFAFEEAVTQNAGGYSTISINFAVNQYFIVSCQLTTGTESASILGLTLQVER